VSCRQIYRKRRRTWSMAWECRPIINFQISQRLGI